MSGVLGRATSSLAAGLVTPVNWRPATQSPDMPRRVMRLPASGAQVIAIPVDAGRLRDRTPVQGTLPLPAVDPGMRAPWGEPEVPFAGVTVTTSQVPLAWLRPPARQVTHATIIPIRPARTTPQEPALDTAGNVGASAGATGVPPLTTPATIIQLPHAPRTLPPVLVPQPVTGRRGRFRRGLTLAVGLLVSLVAVEVAARSGRR